MKHHCYQLLLLCVFNHLLQISEMSGLEMRRMCLQFTVLGPANERKSYRFITPLTRVHRNVMTEGAPEMVHFFSILTVEEHTKHTLQSFLWCFLFMLEVTTPPWPIQPPQSRQPRGNTAIWYHFWKTWLNLCWERCTGLHFSTPPPPARRKHT